MAAPLTANIRPGQGPAELSLYEASGGYQGLRKALEMSPKEVQDIVKKSGLRGRGGAGFPTGQKWSFVPPDAGFDRPGGAAAKPAKPRYLVVNADEKEPGTMKDRFLMEGDPHQLIEGAIIAAYAIQATAAYVFLRREYAEAARALRHAIEEAYAKGFLGERILGSSYSLELHLHISAGRYMCGEETGLLNALEGKRATPRNKPPFPQVCGLWGRPTIVNNVETLSNLPHIFRQGTEWYKALSPSADAGTKIFGVSGKVKRPGLWELPMGAPLREILFQYAGGMRDGVTLRGLLPGGASTEFLGPDKLDVRMDFDSLVKAGSRLGTGTIVVLDDKTCPVEAVLSLERFFARESCGFCTPCREGLPWIVRTLEALEEGLGEQADLEMLEAHSRLLGPGRTFCPLAPGAMEPLASALRLFRDEFDAHVRTKRCPWR